MSKCITNSANSGSIRCPGRNLSVALSHVRCPKIIGHKHSDALLIERRKKTHMLGRASVGSCECHPINVMFDMNMTNMRVDDSMIADVASKIMIYLLADLFRFGPTVLW